MKKLGQLNTLRNQIFIGFMLVMIIVLASVGAFTYEQVSVLLRNNAEKHIQQTAVQAMGKLDVLLGQIDTLTAQVATNASIQQLLAQEADGKRISFEERQSLQQDARKYEAYATGIRSMEMYTTDYRRLFPLDDISLDNRVPMAWINRVDSGKGRLLWLGFDPQNPDVVVAMRHVRLVDRSFIHAGYLMVYIEKSYFELASALTDNENKTGESMGLFDGMGQEIYSDFPADGDAGMMLDKGGEIIAVEGESYIAVQQESEVTGWKLVILTPVNYTTAGISVLRTAIMVSAAVGGLLFLVLTFILSTMITRPILTLIKAMRGARFGLLKANPNSSSTMEINELNNTYNQMVDSLNELIEVVYQKEIIQSRTELKALQSQINPHFLFNTLEAFYWELDDKGEEELAQIVVAMSGLFRYVINRTDDDEWVTLGDELDHAERYLKIMEMRMVDRLVWRIEADEECRKVPLPKLLIQPIVENAILHGIEQRVGIGTVILRAEPSSRNGYIRMVITDDGRGMDTDTVFGLLASMKEGHISGSKGTGVGISNVERRLRLYYPSENNGLDIQSELGRGTTVMFEIPNRGGGESGNEDDIDR
ncbi:two-component system sensor histidine kinase YesM [Paenibacillus endophyticus]|uniref:histidine kinase n=1 Tax=Paenibacillus endophyticus TaxID=1294268 RepID=A0A7W5CBP1_9BACL|nr:sensor histidine kinase [Paenibacillus endophyticus]MBB3154742.1 two-component system sensor histidine kinase YesM [Paenibacillus endophyticus]